MSRSPVPFSRRQIISRAFWAAGGALAAPALLTACGSESATGGSSKSGSKSAPADVDAKWPRIRSRQVVVSGFGGETYEIRQKECFDPYSEVAGARVVQAAWDYGKFLSMLESSSPEWDLIDFDGYSVAGLIASGKAPGKLADWVRRCDLVPKAYQDYCAGGYAWSQVLGWSTKLDSAPTSWADFFDTKKFPGKRAFPKSLYMGVFELALLADGVPKDKIYPLDFERAIAKLNELKPHMVFYDTYAQGQQYMAQGSTSMIATSSARMIQLKNDGKPVDFTFQDAMLYPWSSFTMPQKPQHADAANALLDYMSTPEQQALMSKKIYLGPVVSKALDLLSDKELALTPSAPDNVAKQLSVDVEYLGKTDAEYVEKFTNWVGA
ncbi:extracellular solute-binding protein [Streptomyces himalayensis]|uniref:Extracellular solute-binding protein n=1 Tax=Streptomyces himalayensis subsp. himalayensis TaxID=2756131 RepID=A0A7W0IBD5_9ACTN|nr:extracellular solute-binding protein [Streptomyces himalayensis]MBA2949400.1 extracellular solute-binding protein [Streptomyces himalayensis subsp. himalayensis]